MMSKKIGFCLLAGLSLMLSLPVRAMEEASAELSQQPQGDGGSGLRGWYDYGKEKLSYVKDWAAKSENFMYYIPALAQWFASTVEFFGTGDQRRAWDGFLRALYLGGSAHFIPKFARLVYENPKLIPAFLASVPLMLGSNVLMIRNERLQEFLDKSDFYKNLTKLGDYGFNPFNTASFAALAYAGPVATKVTLSNLSLFTAVPWVSYMIANFGISASALRAFFLANPRIYDVATNLLLGLTFPALVAQLVWQYKGKEIKEYIGTQNSE